MQSYIASVSGWLWLMWPIRAGICWVLTKPPLQHYLFDTKTHTTTPCDNPPLLQNLTTTSLFLAKLFLCHILYHTCFIIQVSLIGVCSRGLYLGGGVVVHRASVGRMDGRSVINWSALDQCWDTVLSGVTVGCCDRAPPVLALSFRNSTLS